MGEAKRRSLHRREILAGSPACIFCAGDNPATTIDHVPPITIFSRRQRPSGLEFAACLECNNGSKAADQVAGLLSRIGTEPGTQLELEEFTKCLRDVGRRRPEILQEMQPTFRQKKDARRLVIETVGALNCRGPLLNEAMESFAAKVGVALDFNETGQVLPKDAKIFAWWITNERLFEDTFPFELVELLGDVRTLAQGSMSAREQFAFASRAMADAPITVHFAAFRAAFGIFAVVSRDPERLPRISGMEDMPLFRPGWLRSNSSPADGAKVAPAPGGGGR